MDNICQICHCKFPSLKALHIHVSRREKIKLEDYYPKFFPKKDLYTLYPIEYKDYEQYFFSNFSSRKNMAKWFENNQDSDYAKDLSVKLVLLTKLNLTFNLGVAGTVVSTLTEAVKIILEYAAFSGITRIDHERAYCVDNVE